MISTIIKSIDKLLLFNVILLLFICLVQRAEMSRLKSELSGISGEFKTCTDTINRQNEYINRNAITSDKKEYKEADKEILSSMKDYKTSSYIKSDTVKLEAIKAQQREFFK